MVNVGLAKISRSDHREMAWIWGLLFVASMVCALVLTLGGVQWLIHQLAAAVDFKAALITTVLGLGFVFIGPILLLALAVLSPPWWLRGLKQRAKRFFTGAARL